MIEDYTEKMSAELMHLNKVQWIITERTQGP